MNVGNSHENNLTFNSLSLSLLTHTIHAHHSFAKPGLAMALAMCSTSTSSFFSGSTALQVCRGESKLTCRKQDIHPKFFTAAKVYCNGELVMTTGGTQGEYIVDVWSGNHPFYQGNKSALLLDADRVDKFRQRYAGLSNLNEIPVLTTGEIVYTRKKKGGLKGKGGKK